MPEFRDREEYERWKKAREEELRARSRPPYEPAGQKGEPGSITDEAPPATSSPSFIARDLVSIDQLLNGTWMIFKHRAGTLIGLSAFSFLLALAVFISLAGASLLVGLFLESAMVPLLVGGATAGALGAIIVFCWGQAAIVLAVTDERLGFGNALASGWRRLWDFIWLYSAAGFIILGGYMLFIAPGVILLVWFGFSQFLLAEEKEKGMRSLLASKEYVRGLWGEVFLRLLVIWLISVAIGSVPLIGSILSILAMPAMTIYTYLTYESVKTMKGRITFDDSPGEKAKWIGIGVVGHLVPVLIVILLWHLFKGLCPPFTEILNQLPM